jgi:GNAT superfamily N-acetyltransferase
VNITIAEAAPDEPRLAPLLRALREELDERYPEEIGFDHPQVPSSACFAMAMVDGRAVGCCALLPTAVDPTHGELKRMYVVPALRGRGVAKRLIAEVEALAGKIGYTRLRLETGVRQPEAIAVYVRAGFTPIPNYPPYDTWELSRCFAKTLA